MANPKSYIPLKEIIDFHRLNNVYEFTSAAIRRSTQLTAIRGKSTDESGDHIISTALNEVLSKKIHYTIATDDNVPLS